MRWLRRRKPAPPSLSAVDALIDELRSASGRLTRWTVTGSRTVDLTVTAGGGKPEQGYQAVLLSCAPEAPPEGTT